MALAPLVAFPDVEDDRARLFQYSLRLIEVNLPDLGARLIENFL